MMNRRWIVTSILSIIILIPISLITQAQNTQIYLSPSDNIQTVIETISTGSTIILLPGEYQQTFTISKQLIITAIDPSSTLINVTTEQNKPAITITAEQVSISNLTIQNNGPGLYTTGIRVLTENTSIHHCTFQNTPIGISIWSNNNSIHNCSFIHCADEGIVLLSTSYSTAHYNQISYCYFDTNCDAIELQRSCHNVIEHCIMINNTHSGIDAIDKNNDYNTIQHCQIRDNTVHGIYFTQSKENKIINCTFKNNQNGDIIIPDSTHINISPPILENITFNSIQQPLESKENTSDIISSKNESDPMPIFSQIFEFFSQIFQYFRS